MLVKFELREVGNAGHAQNNVAFLNELDHFVPVQFIYEPFPDSLELFIFDASCGNFKSHFKQDVAHHYVECSEIDNEVKWAITQVGKVVVDRLVFVQIKDTADVRFPVEDVEGDKT